MITVANCNLLVEAQVICAALKSSGLVAHIPDEFTIENAPYLALAIGGVRVQVKDADAIRAREIISAASPSDHP